MFKYNFDRNCFESENVDIRVTRDVLYTEGISTDGYNLKEFDLISKTEKKEKVGCISAHTTSEICYINAVDFCEDVLKKYLEIEKDLYIYIKENGLITFYGAMMKDDYSVKLILGKPLIVLSKNRVIFENHKLHNHSKVWVEYEGFIDGFRNLNIR